VLLIDLHVCLCWLLLFDLLGAFVCFPSAFLFAWLLLLALLRSSCLLCLDAFVYAMLLLFALLAAVVFVCFACIVCFVLLCFAR
jgi:hypothetical protein